MLASDIIIRARDTLADPTGDRWSDQRLLRLLDEAQSTICSKSKCLRASVDIVAHSGQSSYTMPLDMSLVTRVKYNDKPLLVTSREYLDFEIGSMWTKLVGVPEYAIFDKNDKGTILLAPIPTFTVPQTFDIATANLITVFYIRKPKPIVALTDTLDLDEDYKIMLAKYVSGIALRDDMDAQNRAFGNEELAIFNSWLASVEVDAAKDFTSSVSYSTMYRSMS